MYSAQCTHAHIVLRFVNTKIYNYKRGAHTHTTTSTANAKNWNSVVTKSSYTGAMSALSLPAAVVRRFLSLLFGWNLNISIANHHLNEYNRFKSRRWKRKKNPTLCAKMIKKKIEKSKPNDDDDDDGDCNCNDNCTDQTNQIECARCQPWMNNKLIKNR